MINKEKYIFEYQNEVSDKVYCANIYAYNLVEAEESFKNKYKNCIYISVKTPIGGQYELSTTMPSSIYMENKLWILL